MEWIAPAICRFSEIDGDGFVGVQPAYFGTDEIEGGGPSLATMHPFGFQSRPRDPDVDGEGSVQTGAPLLLAYYGGRGYGLPLFDPRNAGEAALPMPDKGGAVLYADVGNGVFATLEMSGTTGAMTFVVPTGATMNFKAPAGRQAVLSATGLDITGITNAGVVSADDPGASPSPVAIASAIGVYVTATETFEALVLAALLKVPAPLTPGEIQAINTAAAARATAAANLLTPYPTGMIATRLNAR